MLLIQYHIFMHEECITILIFKSSLLDYKLEFAWNLPNILITVWRPLLYAISASVSILDPLAAHLFNAELLFMATPILKIERKCIGTYKNRTHVFQGKCIHVFFFAFRWRATLDPFSSESRTIYFKKLLYLCISMLKYGNWEARSDYTHQIFVLQYLFL